jgi:putative spermidine/putrescine transport system permease protein
LDFAWVLLWVSIASTVVSSVISLQPSGCRNRNTDILTHESGFPTSGLVGGTFIVPLAKRVTCTLGGFAWFDYNAGAISDSRTDRYGIGVILSYIGKEIPFLTIIILSVLRSQSVGYDVVAENLGASRWQRLRYVTIPQVLPALLAGDLLVFGFIFSSYEVPALLGVGYPRTLPVLALRFFLNSDLRARSEGMVISLIITLIVVIVAVVSLRVGGSQE